MLFQRFKNGVFAFLWVVWQGDEFLRPAVGLAAFKIHDAPAQRTVRGFLVGAAQGGPHVQAPGVGFIPILRKHQLANHLGDVFRMHFLSRCRGFDVQDLRLRGLGLLCAEEAVFQHAFDDVLLPNPRSLGVYNRVVGRRCFG